mmetsp:Transcript_13912/g.18185  ORF Transcript_13912/g.18185 Transcript_13912/m.18185 type:complete len:465 (+) Transcript_13912:186-1580(+)
MAKENGASQGTSVKLGNLQDWTITKILPLLVGLDMLAVAIVVPMLQTYFKLAGVTSSTQREFLSSAYSASQIVGGLAIGGANDAGIISDKNTLLLSFIGSSVSYGMIGFFGDSLSALILSRIVVGTVKQTMTVTSSIVSKNTNPQDRAGHMGKLTASATAAWMIGPSIGALLYKNYSATTPAIVASLLFMVNSCIAFLYLPSQNPSQTKSKPSKNGRASWYLFVDNLKDSFSSRQLACCLIAYILFGWVRRATSYFSLGSFYEDMYGIETYQRGYISSYHSVLQFLVQSRLVKPLLDWYGGEMKSAVVGTIILSMTTFVETQASIPLFVAFIAPLVAISMPLVDLSLKTLVTKVAPKATIGSALAVLNVLENLAAVTVPFYRVVLFQILSWISHCIPQNYDLANLLSHLSECTPKMSGDPEPVLWILSAGIHWLVLALVFLLLLGPETRKTKRSSSGFSKDKVE